LRVPTMATEVIRVFGRFPIISNDFGGLAIDVIICNSYAYLGIWY